MKSNWFLSSQRATSGVLIALAGFSLTNCASNPRTGKGATAGAIVGGVVGAATGKGLKGIAIGAAAGAAAGGAAGLYLDKRRKELAAVVPTQKTDRGLLVTLSSEILFDFDRADLKSEAQKTLSDLATILVKYPDDRLEVSGFTDDVGAAEYNKRLSAQRADKVKEYLTVKGLKQNQVASIGEGELASPDNSEASRRRNRKVEIYIQPELPQG